MLNIFSVFLLFGGYLMATLIFIDNCQFT